MGRKNNNPGLTVDIIIRDIDMPNSIALIERKNEPYGWALPGGFVDCGETCLNAAIREAKEETNLDIFGVEFFGIYDNPERDPRHHNISIVYTAWTSDRFDLKAKDDAKDAVFSPITSCIRRDSLMCFDHCDILRDFFKTIN